MAEISHKEIVAKRMFPNTGTYIGTYINVPEPENLADWYQWNQARMAFHAVRHQVITSDNTRMVEHSRPDAPGPNAGLHIIDVYADPHLGVKKHIPVLAQHITRDTNKQFESLGIPPEMQPTWLPLGLIALRRVSVIY